MIAIKRNLPIVVLGLGLLLSAEPSFASGGGGALAPTLAAGLQKLIELLNGGIARSIAVLAVIGFGIGALTGRIDWTRALQVVIAIGLVFSAAELVDLFRGGNS